MDLGLKDKTAFVAASSQGLGKSVAYELAQEGARIIICGRNKDQLEKTKQEIEKKTNQELLALVGDLSVAEERDGIIKKALHEYSRVDILVTNTGGPPAGKFESFTMEDWENAYHQLLASAVGLINGFFSLMNAQPWRCNIYTTSMTCE